MKNTEIKDKAKELYKKFSSNLEEWGWQEIGREQAIMCAEEIICTLREVENYKDVNPNLPIRFWEEVLKELKVMKL